jgi:hypothetical protein
MTKARLLRQVQRTLHGDAGAPFRVLRDAAVGIEEHRIARGG